MQLSMLYIVLLLCFLLKNKAPNFFTQDVKVSVCLQETKDGWSHSDSLDF